MYQKVLDFWFKEIDPVNWWKKDAVFDRSIAAEFGALHSKAKMCELYEWRSSPHGRLAEIIVLDQFSRNIYRAQPEAFASDGMALALSQEAVCIHANKALSVVERSFLYLPFMHSESALIHEIAVTLYNEDGLEDSLAFEKKHKKIIDRFGRYPHRNAILGRVSTEEEIAFLKEPGSSF